MDPDTKSLIIAGDQELIIEVLMQLYNSEFNKSTRNNLRKSYKSNQELAEGGIMIEAISEDKELAEADSCLEYLILSFCHSFSLKPKQSAGLLAQGYKFLAQIVAKGLKSNFEPVKL